MSFQKILVAIDRSELGPTVFARAMELAQAFQAKLYLLHCLIVDTSLEPALPPLSSGMSDLGIYPHLVDQLTWDEQVQTQQQQAIALLQTYNETAWGLGLSTEFAFKVGEPGHAICETARDWSADLILMGRRGRRGLAEALLGSISNYVIHHAPCSVLVIQ
uniref:UspA domain protein n=1 Tax=Cyanothece sp. (strain PCC 7425 / ATCC 29141) TaxID=395961 RepID=B8HST5_CYAP4